MTVVMVFVQGQERLSRRTFVTLRSARNPRYRAGMSKAHKNATPTVSLKEQDGTLAELLFDSAARSTSLAVKAVDGRICEVADLRLGNNQTFVPYSPDNPLIANGTVLLPSAIGEEMDVGDVLAAVTAFIHRYVALPADFEEIAAHYVLLTWVYDAFEVVPYLRLRGDYGTGKSRALKTIGALCYKPFLASGASTVSPIFHILDTFQGTLVLDEADFRFSDATADLTKILNNGNMRGLPVLRTMTSRHKELYPQAFRVFGPKIVGMRQSFSDSALESRFITHDTESEVVRPDIPIHLPASFDDEARELRNLLLRFRLDRLANVSLKPERAIAGMEPRVNQMALPLLSLADDPAVRERMASYLAREQERRRQDRADTYEAMMVQAVWDGFTLARVPYVSVSEIAERFNRVAARELGKPMTNRWVGGFLRNRLQLSTMKTGGVYVVPPDDRAKVERLVVRMGLSESSPTR